MNSRARELFLLLALVLLARVPFWNHAIQGDDVYYLAGAQHALVDPLHPSHARYYFLGELVDMRGHSHPPLNSWMLGALLALFGSVAELPLHAAYTLFSLMAVWAAWSIARRHSPHPAWAVLLLIATPAFFVNGNSLESDLPFLAFWLTAVACLEQGLEPRRSGWLMLSAVSAACAGVTAYQGVMLTALLGWMVWRSQVRPRLAWVPVIAAPVALAAYQFFEFWSAGQFPAAVLAGYLSSRGFQAPMQKLRSAAALTSHLAWVMFPALALVAFRARRWWFWAVAALAAAGGAMLDRDPLFWISCALGALILCRVAEGLWSTEERLPALWVAGFFAASAGIFFAGSARYLLPLALPVAILATRNAARPWLAAGFALQLTLSLAMALVNASHWDAYRRFAADLAPRIDGKRAWVNSEWGLRHYFEDRGARVPGRDEWIRAGDTVVSSRLAIPVPLRSQGGVPRLVEERVVTSAIPLRIIGLDSRSAFSVAGRGLLPFEISRGPIDVLRAEVWDERPVTSSMWRPGDAGAQTQVVAGLDPDGWSGADAMVLLKVPDGTSQVQVTFGVSEQAAPQTVELLVDGVVRASGRFTKPGAYSLSAGVEPAGSIVQVGLRVDRTFQIPPDQRRLGVLVTEWGFRAATAAR